MLLLVDNIKTAKKLSKPMSTSVLGNTTVKVVPSLVLFLVTHLQSLLDSIGASTVIPRIDSKLVLGE